VRWCARPVQVPGRPEGLRRTAAITIREHRKTLDELLSTIVHLNRTCTSESPILRRRTEVIDEGSSCLVHGQPGVLKEMSEKFEGIKIKRSQPSAAPTGMCFFRCRAGVGCDAERHGMHSYAGAWERSRWRRGKRDLAVIIREKRFIFF
jgi:hypothetical protein